MSNEIKPLFVAGPGRSGTTALVRYLNVHPEILLCRERFTGWPREKITPEVFTPKRIMDFEDGYEPAHRNTEARRENHREMLEQKDFDHLRWIGDKHPNYVRALPTLARNNPDAKFLLTHRPVGEVARSTEARSKNPNDNWLGGRDGFKVGIRQWNRAVRHTRDFLAAGGDALVVGYHELFSDSASFAPLLSSFLGVEFGSEILQTWNKMSREHESQRREQSPWTETQRDLIESLTDKEAEAYVLECIERQRSAS